MDRLKQSQTPRRTDVAVEIGAAFALLGTAVWIFIPRAAGVLAVASIEFRADATDAAARVEDIWLGAACWAMLASALTLVCHAGRRALVSGKRRELAANAVV